MVIIAFSTKTSKIMPRILCRHFCHCAPIVPCMRGTGRPYVMHQFVRRGCVAQISLGMRDMNLLRRGGWAFVYVDVPAPKNIRMANTCVGFCRNAIGMRHGGIFTPDDLYRHLVRGWK